MRALASIVFALVASAANAQERGVPFWPYDLGRTQEVAANELFKLLGDYDSAIYLELLRHAGADAETVADIPDYLRGLVVIPCPADRFRFGIYYAVGNDRYGTFSRSPHRGEQCLVDLETGFMLSLYCGNPLVELPAPHVRPVVISASEVLKRASGNWQLPPIQHCWAPCTTTFQRRTKP